MGLLVSEISSYLEKDFIGNDFEINEICSISHLKSFCISFINKKNYLFDTTKKSLLILLDGYEIKNDIECSIIYSKNPRLDFIKIANLLYNNQKREIAKTASIGNNCQIGNNVSIGHYCVINDNVSIGDNTILNNHVVIESNTIIGKNCYIKSGAVIGEDGFGFEKDENDIPLKFPHIGNVIIGDNVEVGAKTTIAKGALTSTIINDHVKIDDQVHIAHNCTIGKNTIITACTEISGSVRIGSDCWIGPNSSIRDGIILHNNSFIGVGSNISHSTNFVGQKIANIANLSLRDVVKFKKILEKK